ncbi:hypothetical protein ACFORH_16640 [Amycolatopsis roodepoortensis]|uniref:DUF5671 domain-containing protein n=1 Tax=Amycolatopsis roodepoortensis TaxID=700274 RepID=A0ABR9LD93_9PSEU|nr:hypothetical protein [Amycolatopsis roodepoortensis]MBE1578081.1 hypothetical protein [Amycolatopsis roodepoortensis]
MTIRRPLRRGLRAPAPPEPEPAAGPAHALKLVGAVLANTTLLTALLYYFGLVYTQTYFAYFRVHYTLLGQTPDEIFGRGVDGVLLPLTGVAGAALLFLVLTRFLKIRLGEASWSRLLRICSPVAGVLGLALLAGSTAIAFDPEPLRDRPGLPGVGFALGVLMALFSWRHWTSRRTGSTRSNVAELVTGYALVSIGLFWAVGDYSGAVGTSRAFEASGLIPSRPAATLYSAESLNLTAHGVTQVKCADPGSAYKYRYTGLKLLLQSSGQYVFLPSNWRASTGVAFVIPKTDKLRLEFGPSRSVPPPAC